jgi:hypothetical protein
MERRYKQKERELVKIKRDREREIHRYKTHPEFSNEV